MNVKIATLVLVLCCCQSLWAGPLTDLSAVAPNAGKELQLAESAFKSGDLEGCTKQLELAVKKFPTLPPMKLMLARLFLSANQIQQGQGLLEQCGRDHADHPEVYLAFADLALSQGRLTDASLHLEHAAKLNPPKSWSNEQKSKLKTIVLAGKTSIAESRQDWKTARDLLKAWTGNDPKNGALRDRFAAAVFQAGDSEEALKQLRQSFSDDPKQMPPEASMGALFAMNGDPKSAKTWFEAGLKKHPKDGRVFFEYATFLLMQGDAKAAKPVAGKAADLGLSSRDLSLRQGLIARQLGEFSSAESFFEAVQRVAPQDFEATNQLILAMVEQLSESKRNRARELAELNVRLYPQSTEALATLGWTYYKLGRKAEAEQILRRATNSGPIRNDITYYLARVMADNKSPDAAEAKKLVLKALAQPGLFVMRNEAQAWLDRP